MHGESRQSSLMSLTLTVGVLGHQQRHHRCRHHQQHLIQTRPQISQGSLRVQVEM